MRAYMHPQLLCVLLFEILFIDITAHIPRRLLLLIHTMQYAS